MDWLNYHHLFYFWAVAREGRIAAAGTKLRRTQPTLTKQIRLLERSLGEKLFRKEGRKLVLTETGHTVFRYADDIFATGRELVETLKGFPAGHALRMRIGIANVIPKLIANRFLRPAFELSDAVRIACREDDHSQLLRDLGSYVYDVVLTDTPAGPELGTRTFNHPLGESGVTFLAAARLVRGVNGRFPRNLDGARFLLPTENTGLRRSLDQWFETRKIQPRIIGEFEDSALMSAFAQAGEGVMIAPTVIEHEVARQHRLVVLGRIDEVRERYFAITMERKIRHPGVEAITRHAAREPAPNPPHRGKGNARAARGS